MLLCRGRGPNKRFLAFLALFARVLILDEFRTSRICSTCQRLSLEPLPVGNNRFPPHALRVCHHCRKVSSHQCARPDKAAEQDHSCGQVCKTHSTFHKRIWDLSSPPCVSSLICQFPACRLVIKQEFVKEQSVRIAVLLHERAPVTSSEHASARCSFTVESSGEYFAIFCTEMLQVWDRDCNASRYLLAILTQQMTAGPDEAKRPEPFRRPPRYTLGAVPG